MATGARIVLTKAGWRNKSEFSGINCEMNPDQARKAKRIAGKIARKKIKEETRKIIEEI